MRRALSLFWLWHCRAWVRSISWSTGVDGRQQTGQLRHHLVRRWAGEWIINRPSISSIRASEWCADFGDEWGKEVRDYTAQKVVTSNLVRFSICLDDFKQSSLLHAFRQNKYLQMLLYCPFAIMYLYQLHYIYYYTLYITLYTITLQLQYTNKRHNAVCAIVLRNDCEEVVCNSTEGSSFQSVVRLRSQFYSSLVR